MGLMRWNFDEFNTIAGGQIWELRGAVKWLDFHEREREREIDERDDGDDNDDDFLMCEIEWVRVWL